VCGKLVDRRKNKSDLPSVCQPCRKVARTVPCAQCGDLFERSEATSRFCSASCAAYGREYTGSCADCGTGDDVTGHGVRLCPACRKIRKAARQARWVAAHPDAANAHYVAKARRRRAAKLGLPSEPYTLAEIATRDDHECQLCHRPVDMTLSGLDDWGPTIDHVIPIIRGGPDTRDNVQLAHRTCNVAKGSKVFDDSFCTGHSIM
jgi:5-methylcytosine-specific restriction endonuclease McrA